MTRAVLLDGVDVSQDAEGPEWRRRVRAAITEADANFAETYAAPGAVAVQNKYTAVATGTPAAAIAARTPASMRSRRERAGVMLRAPPGRFGRAGLSSVYNTSTFCREARPPPLVSRFCRRRLGRNRLQEGRAPRDSARVA